MLGTFYVVHGLDLSSDAITAVSLLFGLYVFVGCMFAIICVSTLGVLRRNQTADPVLELSAYSTSSVATQDAITLNMILANAEAVNLFLDHLFKKLSSNDF